MTKTTKSRQPKTMQKSGELVAESKKRSERLKSDAFGAKVMTTDADLRKD
jgi:hypothetical protein